MMFSFRWGSLLSGSILLLLTILLLATTDARAAGSSWNVNNNVLYKNGAPIFPRGFYYVSYYSGEKTRRIADLNKIAAAGFNFIATPVDRSDTALFSTAESLGVNIAMEFNDDPGSLITQFKSSPALAFLVTFDDVDKYVNNAPKYTPTYVGERSSALKALAPGVLTYISGGYPTRITNYLGTADTIGYQNYPIPSEPLSSMTSAYLNPVITAFHDTMQPMISNVQSFGWNGTQRFPTPDELRNMSYQAMIAGVQGILYYTYYDEVTDLNNQPTLWNELVKMSGEIAALEPYLVSNTRKALTTGQSLTYAASWKSGDNLVVAIANTSTGSKTVSMTINEDLNGSFANMFSGRQDLMSLSGKTVTGTLPASSVQVYKLGLVTQGTTSGGTTGGTTSGGTTSEGSGGTTVTKTKGKGRSRR